jgi:hypothetical protein
LRTPHLDQTPRPVIATWEHHADAVLGVIWSFGVDARLIFNPLRRRALITFLGQPWRLLAGLSAWAVS